MNRLANEKSAYLQHAAHQKIDWYPWSEAPFEKARTENKPLFLSSGAVWCHWCHVMAAESFENEEIAGLMNRLFVNIKLDRDERPDIDRRYQQAVSAMGAGGGWPLSVFLTPNKEPFFGGTYFPPEDRNGIPGFKSVLQAVSNFYHVKRDEAVQYAKQVLETLRPEGLAPASVNAQLLNDAVEAVLSHADPKHGGFGTAPKFPLPGALEFLIHRYVMNRDLSLEQVIRAALDSMARGGIHDQLGGGFHRYSVDAEWIVPHFEKMADDNAWMLRTYALAYTVFREEQYRMVLGDIIRFAGEVLADPEGGFYTSQDADVSPSDEGGYFTWSREDFRRVLSEQEYAVLSQAFLDSRGAMPHDPAKYVLWAARSKEAIAADLGIGTDRVEAIIQQGRKKLLESRNSRPAPFVDKTMYSSLNGLMIGAYLSAFRVLHDGRVREFALKSLDRILRQLLIGDTLFHTDGIPAVLDDYVYLIDALVAAYETTAIESYRDRASSLMDQCLRKFADYDQGGFFDTEHDVLGTRLKRIEDVPHPSANSLAIINLLKLAFITGTTSYRKFAEKSVALFAGSAREMGVHAGSYFCAADAYLNLLTLTIEAPAESALAAGARETGAYTAITYGENTGRILPCIGGSCLEPITDLAGLVQFRMKF